MPQNPTCISEGKCFWGSMPSDPLDPCGLVTLIIGERERANLVVRLARFFYIYIYIYMFIYNFRAHGLRRYPVFADTLHTCSIHIRNVKYKGQQLFCRDISSCFKRFLSKLTSARYSDTTRVVRWQVTR